MGLDYPRPFWPCIAQMRRPHPAYLPQPREAVVLHALGSGQYRTPRSFVISSSSYSSKCAQHRPSCRSSHYRSPWTGSKRAHAVLAFVPSYALSPCCQYLLEYLRHISTTSGDVTAVSNEILHEEPQHRQDTDGATNTFPIFPQRDPYPILHRSSDVDRTSSGGHIRSAGYHHDLHAQVEETKLL